MIEILKNLIEQISTHGIERVFKRYYSLYRAQVVSNLDEEKRGRIQVTVPGIFGELVLPNWAEPRDFRSAGKGYGEFYPPEVKDWVFVEFEKGDSRFPVYSGGWCGADERGEDFKDGDKGPVVRGYRNKWGAKFLFDETPGKENLKISVPNKDGSKALAITLDASEGAEKATITTMAGHAFVLDDTEGKEAIYLIHKAGSQVQIDEKGSIKIFSKAGNLLNMNAEDGSVTAASKDGSLISLKDNIVVSDATGKTLITVAKDGLTVTTGGDAVLQASTFTVNAGAVSIEGGKGKLSLGSGKVALGSAAGELIDLVIQAISALLDDPALVVTPTGPSSGLIGVAKIKLTLIKVKLTLIKGTL